MLAVCSLIGCWTLYIVVCMDGCYDVWHHKSRLSHLALSSLLLPNQVTLSRTTSLDPMQNSRKTLAKNMPFDIKSLTKYCIWLCTSFIHIVITPQLGIEPWLSSSSQSLYWLSCASQKNSLDPPPHVCVCVCTHIHTATRTVNAINKESVNLEEAGGIECWTDMSGSMVLFLECPHSNPCMWTTYPDKGSNGFHQSTQVNVGVIT